MKNLKNAGLVLILLVGMLSSSCSNSNSTDKSSYENPELWETIKASEWASWNQGIGCQMKFIGDKHAIVLDYVQDPEAKTWKTTRAEAGTVEFIDDNWFLIHLSDKTVAYMFSKANLTIENSNGLFFKKSKWGAFQTK